MVVALTGLGGDLTILAGFSGLMIFIMLAPCPANTPAGHSKPAPRLSPRGLSTGFVLPLRLSLLPTISWPIASITVERKIPHRRHSARSLVVKTDPLSDQIAAGGGFSAQRLVQKATGLLRVKMQSANFEHQT